jgi:hypothetical protein
MPEINIHQISYLEKFSNKYTPQQLKLGTDLRREINDKKNGPITREQLKITPEIFEQYLELFNSQKLKEKKDELLLDSGNVAIQSSPAPTPTAINTTTIKYTPAAEYKEPVITTDTFSRVREPSGRGSTRRSQGWRSEFEVLDNARSSNSSSESVAKPSSRKRLSASKRRLSFRFPDVPRSDAASIISRQSGSRRSLVPSSNEEKGFSGTIQSENYSSNSSDNSDIFTSNSESGSAEGTRSGSEGSTSSFKVHHISQKPQSQRAKVIQQALHAVPESYSSDEYKEEVLRVSSSEYPRAPAPSELRGSVENIRAAEPIYFEETDLDSNDATIKWRNFDDPANESKAMFDDDDITYYVIFSNGKYYIFYITYGGTNKDKIIYNTSDESQQLDYKNIPQTVSQLFKQISSTSIKPASQELVKRLNLHPALPTGATSASGVRSSVGNTKILRLNPKSVNVGDDISSFLPPQNPFENIASSFDLDTDPLPFKRVVYETPNSSKIIFDIFKNKDTHKYLLVSGEIGPRSGTGRFFLSYNQTNPNINFLYSTHTFLLRLHLTQDQYESLEAAIASPSKNWTLHLTDPDVKIQFPGTWYNKESSPAAELSASVAPVPPPKPLAGLPSASPGAPSPLTSPTEYIWLFDIAGNTATKVTIQPDATGTNFNIASQFKYDKKIKSFFTMLETQRKRKNFELVELTQSPSLNYKLTIPISAEEYRTFLEYILSEEHPWKITTKDRGAIELPGFWFRTIQELNAMTPIYNKFNFIEAILGKLEIKCHTLKTQKEQSDEYGNSTGLYKLTTANPKKSIPTTENSIARNMYRVIQAEKEINDSLLGNASHLQKKYIVKCKQRLAKMKLRIQIICDRSVIPRSLMTQAAAAAATEVMEASQADQLVAVLSRASVAQPPKESWFGSLFGRSKSKAQPANVSQADDLIRKAFKIIGNMSIELRNLQLDRNSDLYRGKVEESLANIQTYIGQLSTLSDRTDNVQRTISYLNTQYGNLSREYNLIMHPTSLSSAAMESSAVVRSHKPLPLPPTRPPTRQAATDMAMKASAGAAAPTSSFALPQSRASAATEHPAPEPPVIFSREDIKTFGELERDSQLTNPPPQPITADQIHKRFTSSIGFVNITLDDINATIDEYNTNPRNAEDVISRIGKDFKDMPTLIYNSIEKYDKMKKNFPSDSRLREMLRSLHKMNTFYEQLKKKYNHNLKDKSGNLPPPLPDLLRMLSQSSAGEAPVQIHSVPVSQQGSLRGSSDNMPSPMVASPVGSLQVTPRQISSSGHASEAALTSSRVSKLARQVTPAKQSNDKAGVGIYFREEYGALIVREIVPGGSAAANGAIKPGDIIISVDGRSVEGQGIKTLRDYIIGQVGTFVELSFKRPSPSATRSSVEGPVVIFSVTLERKQSRSSDAAPDVTAVPHAATIPSTEELRQKYNETLENIKIKEATIIAASTVSGDTAIQQSKQNVKERYQLELNSLINNLNEIIEQAKISGLTLQPYQPQPVSGKEQDIKAAVAALPPALVVSRFRVGYQGSQAAPSTPYDTSMESSRSSHITPSKAIQRVRGVSPSFPGSAAAQRAREPSPFSIRHIKESEEVVFNYNLNEDKETVQTPTSRDQDVINAKRNIDFLKGESEKLKKKIMDTVQIYNDRYPNKPRVETVNSQPGTDSGSLTVRLSPLDGNTQEGKALISELENLGTQHFNLIMQIRNLRDSIMNRVGALTGGKASHRSSHISNMSKYKHKNKNKTKHKHNYNYKARPSRKNKKTIKKYRGMSRMHVMPRMQKQNVAVYRKHKKTTRKFKPTRHAKMNKNKPKNSNKKSRKFRR